MKEEVREVDTQLQEYRELVGIHLFTETSNIHTLARTHTSHSHPTPTQPWNHDEMNDSDSGNVS